jgi:negative regulator of sigma-B (phosphoserine phosphatase)
VTKSLVPPFPPPQLLDWAAFTRPLPGEPESGDQYLVKPVADGTLVAVVDGLGHGPEAVHAAQLACHVIDQAPHEPIVALVNRCHQTLGDTRGVVMTLASFHRDDRLTWLGVGNVEAVLVRSQGHPARIEESVLLWGGVVGQQLPELRSFTLPVIPGDLVIFATDGIDRAFMEGTTGIFPDDTPERIAEGIVERYAKTNDDSLVLVSRYLGALDE